MHTGAAFARAAAGIAFAGICASAGLAAQTPSPAPSPGASPAASAPSESVTPSETSSPTSSARASPVPSASPSAAASPLPTPTILMLAPDAAPQILWVALSSTTPKPGDIVTGVVLTSSNVASVEGRAGTFIIPLAKTDVGHFEGSCRVPEVPLLMPHAFVVRIVAHNTAGVTAERMLAMRIR